MLISVQLSTNGDEGAHCGDTNSLPCCYVNAGAKSTALLSFKEREMTSRPALFSITAVLGGGGNPSRGMEIAHAAGRAGPIPIVWGLAYVLLSHVMDVAALGC